MKRLPPQPKEGRALGLLLVAYLGAMAAIIAATMFLVTIVESVSR